MKERPIFFNGEMVRAILNGRKTQTRRVISRKGWIVAEPAVSPFHVITTIAKTKPYEGARMECYACPFGMPGDRLWVRETFCIVNDDDEKWIDYRATPRYEESHPAGWENAPDDPDALKWKPSIHMPHWASRITLEVVDVRVERLQDITEEDAFAEGVGKMDLPVGYQAAGNNMMPRYRQSFVLLWDSIYGTWSDNPWVWVVEFKQITGGES